MNELVCIGGGPVGIWTAIQIKKRNPKTNITIYERFETYQRSHVLRLDYWSLTLYAKVLGDSFEKDFLKEVANTTMNKIKLNPTKSVFIKTNDLEIALKKYAQNLGINIIYKKVLTIEEVESLHPNCKHFIAADGANSAFRKQLLGEDDMKKKALQHIIEMKYSVTNKTSKIKLNEVFKVNSEIEFMGFEYVGRFRNNSTPISIRFFIDEKTYELIPGATFKEPLTVEAIKNNSNLKEIHATISTYLNYRKEKCNDTVDYSNIKISKLPLYIYAANKFAIERNEKAWFLTGDAALGVPYFRALNSGLMLGSRLSQILTSRINKLDNNSGITIQTELYNFHRILHIQTEFNIAKGKNMVLDSFNKIRKVKLA
jgi:2-polyprenyl-6-methoxyphenol hydroxylase-like FAD-dependent oxidoreductase